MTNYQAAIIAAAQLAQTRDYLSYNQAFRAVLEAIKDNPVPPTMEEF